MSNVSSLHLIMKEGNISDIEIGSCKLIAFTDVVPFYRFTVHFCRYIALFTQPCYILDYLNVDIPAVVLMLRLKRINADVWDENCHVPPNYMLQKQQFVMLAIKFVVTMFRCLS